MDGAMPQAQPMHFAAWLAIDHFIALVDDVENFFTHGLNRGLKFISRSVGQSCRFAQLPPVSVAKQPVVRETTSLRSLFESQGGAAAPPYHI
jgi:hypothetical protein